MIHGDMVLIERGQQEATTRHPRFLVQVVSKHPIVQEFQGGMVSKIWGPPLRPESLAPFSSILRL